MQLFLEIVIFILAGSFCVAVALLIIGSFKAFIELVRRKRKKEKVRFPINGDLDKVNHWHLYILKLQDGKYYVGITSKTPEIRMQEHLNGVRTAYWTAKHKPLELIYSEDLGDITRRQAEKRENKMVRACMRERGINDVRGGDLTSVEEYIVRFGYIFDREGWTNFTMVVLMTAAFAFIALDKYFFTF